MPANERGEHIYGISVIPHLQSRIIELKENPEGNLPENLREMNFYSWEEVKKFNIGKWFLKVKNKNDEL